MEELILFLMCFVFMFIIYEIFIVAKAKKNVRNKKNNKEPIEIKYLVSKYHLDLKKVNYNQLLQIIALVSSLDISIIVTISLFFEGYLIQLLVALVLAIVVILVSYHFVGYFYKKKGMIRND